MKHSVKALSLYLLVFPNAVLSSDGSIGAVGQSSLENRAHVIFSITRNRR